MPPKTLSNKKSAATAAASWYHCEACDVHITSKEREIHEQLCPITENAETLEYIRNNILYTTSVERRSFSIEELSEMPVKYVNNMIFISEGAMRLAHFHIGQQLVIRVRNQAKVTALVRSVWPIPEKFLTTLFVSEDDFNLNWTSQKGQLLTVQCLPDKVATPAKDVRLQLQRVQDDDQEELQLHDVEHILKAEIKNLCFTQNSLIHMNFFNEALKFKVLDWQSIHDVPAAIEKSVIKKLNRLNLDEFNPLFIESFFQITPKTRLEVVREETLTAAKDGKAQTTDYMITKADIGGLEEQLSLIEESLDFALGFRFMPRGVKISRGLLLYGSSGCGKTLICESMCALVQEKAIKANIIKINTSELFSKFLGETERNLAAYFEKAFASYPHPTLLIIEDVHNLCPKHEVNEITKRVAVAFLSMLDSLSSNQKAQRTLVLTTTSQIESLNPAIRRCGRLDCELEIGAPTPKERAAILKCLLRNVEHLLTAAELDEVAHVTHGFVGADLANLIYHASLNSLKARNSDTLTAADVQASLLHVKPSAMREVLIENPNVRWTDIGGQAELKLKLKQAIEWPLLYPDKFKRLGIKPPRGLLMFGPPGCSKTMIAKALATESQLNFLSIKGPELFSMWVGESERAVREVFRKARQVAPSIVFFDEIDAIGGERADAGSGASVKERVLTQLLTELDGVEALQNVTIVAATNRPDMIDKALLRPGRIDRIVYVGLPDAAARREIFRIKLQKMPVAQDVELEQLVQRTEGYTGAEIQAICHEAALKTLEESFDAEQVTWQQFEYALNTVQPRTSADLLHLYEEYQKKS